MGSHAITLDQASVSKMLLFPFISFFICNIINTIVLVHNVYNVGSLIMWKHNNALKININFKVDLGQMHVYCSSTSLIYIFSKLWIFKMIMSFDFLHQCNNYPRFNNQQINVVTMKDLMSDMIVTTRCNITLCNFFLFNLFMVLIDHVNYTILHK